RAPNGVVGFMGSTASDMKKAVPSCAKSTQGSDARLNAPPVQSVTPVGIELVQLLPASLETTPTVPREPPSSHRSCWWPTRRRSALVGSAATHGSIDVAG